ncbi:hypothetical protein [Rossellomorea sp. LJF3]
MRTVPMLLENERGRTLLRRSKRSVPLRKHGDGSSASVVTISGA